MGNIERKKESEVTQSCPALCSPADCKLPCSSVHGIFQARVLEWVAISFSRGSSRPRDGKVLEWGAIAFSEIESHCLLYSTVWYTEAQPLVEDTLM